MRKNKSKKWKGRVTPKPRISKLYVYIIISIVIALVFTILGAVYSQPIRNFMHQDIPITITDSIKSKDGRIWELPADIPTKLIKQGSDAFVGVCREFAISNNYDGVELWLRVGIYTDTELEIGTIAPDIKVLDHYFDCGTNQYKIIFYIEELEPHKKIFTSVYGKIDTLSTKSRGSTVRLNNFNFGNTEIDIIASGY